MSEEANITSVILDDDPRAINRLKLLCELIPEITIVETFTEPDLAINYITKKEPDLFFLDVEMPQKNRS